MTNHLDQIRTNRQATLRMKSPGQLPMALDTSLRQVPFTMLGFLRTAIAKLRSRNSRSSKIGLAARGAVSSRAAVAATATVISTATIQSGN